MPIVAGNTGDMRWPAHITAFLSPKPSVLSVGYTWGHYTAGSSWPTVHGARCERGPVRVSVPKAGLGAGATAAAAAATAACPAVVALVRAALEPLYYYCVRRGRPSGVQVRRDYDLVILLLRWRGFPLPRHRGPSACRTEALAHAALSPCTITESVVAAPRGREHA